MKTVSMQDLVDIIDEKNKTIEEEKTYSSGLEGVIREQKKAMEAKDEAIEIVTRMKNKAEKLISKSYEKNKAQAKEIENLKGQYKTLDLGFDKKSLQINETQEKEIERLSQEIDRLQHRMLDEGMPSYVIYGTDKN